MSLLCFSISTKEFFSDPAISPVVGGSSCGLCASSPPPPPFFFYIKVLLKPAREIHNISCIVNLVWTALSNVTYLLNSWGKHVTCKSDCICHYRQRGFLPLSLNFSV